MCTFEIAGLSNVIVSHWVGLRYLCYGWISAHDNNKYVDFIDN